jgi:hypothetical protein
MKTATIAILAALLASCSTDTYRGMYDISRDRNQGLQSSQFGQKPGEWPAYEQYELERQGLVKPAGD